MNPRGSVLGKRLEVDPILLTHFQSSNWKAEVFEKPDDSKAGE
jgi:hypothetical protein